jgi:hypothetical protein
MEHYDRSKEKPKAQNCKRNRMGSGKHENNVVDQHPSSPLFTPLSAARRFFEESGYNSLIMSQNAAQTSHLFHVLQPLHKCLVGILRLFALCLGFPAVNPAARGGQRFDVPLERVWACEIVPASFTERDLQGMCFFAITMPLEVVPCLEVGIGTESALEPCNLPTALGGHEQGHILWTYLLGCCRCAVLSVCTVSSSPLPSTLGPSAGLTTHPCWKSGPNTSRW